MVDEGLALVRGELSIGEAEALEVLLSEAGLNPRVVRVTQRRRFEGESLVAVEVYVPAGELARAQQAIAERPITVEPPPAVADASRGEQRCSVHDRPLDLPCARCGTFVCSACVVGEKEPLCDRCDERAWDAMNLKSKRRSRFTDVGCVILVLGLFVAMFATAFWAMRH